MRGEARVSARAARRRPKQRSALRRVWGYSWPVQAAGIAVVAVLLALFWARIVVTVNPGESGVLFRLLTGVRTDRVYPPGLHIVAPWNSLFIYETRKQVVIHQFDVLSSRGLRVRLSLAIRYQPEIDQLGVLHQRIGPDYVRRVVLPQVESALRRELGLRTAEQIYTNEGGVLSKALVLARDEVGRNYVEAEDVVIRSISLPDAVRMAIEEKLTQRELLASYNFRLQTAEEEAERRRRAAQGEADYNTLVDETLTDIYLRHEEILATRALALAPRTSIVMLATQGGDDGARAQEANAERPAEAQQAVAPEADAEVDPEFGPASGPASGAEADPEARPELGSEPGSESGAPPPAEPAP